MIEAKVYEEFDKSTITVCSGVDDPLEEFDTLPKAEEYINELYAKGKREIEVIISRRYYKRLRYRKN